MRKRNKTATQIMYIAACTNIQSSLYPHAYSPNIYWPPINTFQGFIWPLILLILFNVGNLQPEGYSSRHPQHIRSTNSTDTHTVNKFVICSVGLFVVRGVLPLGASLPWPGLELEPEASHNHGSWIMCFSSRPPAPPSPIEPIEAINLYIAT